MSRPSHQAGFTLLETIVAFAITSGTLGLLYQIHAQATRTISLATEYVQVTEFAQSLLAESMLSADIARTENQGVAADSYRWRTRSEPYELDAGPDTSPPGRQAYEFALRHVTVEVSWGTGEGERTFTLETLKPFVRELDESAR